MSLNELDKVLKTNYEFTNILNELDKSAVGTQYLVCKNRDRLQINPIFQQGEQPTTENLRQKLSNLVIMTRLRTGN